MKLSVIVCSLDEKVPQSLRDQVEGRVDVELVVVAGVSPVGKARNEGLRRAVGDWIAWVDSDDEVEENWLFEILVRMDEAQGNGGDVIIIGNRWMTTETWGFERVWSGDDLLGSVLRQDAIYSEMWNFVIRRELWSGVNFSDVARIAEDWEVVPILLARSKHVLSITKCVYRYFVRQGSLTHQNSVDILREEFARALARINQIKELGLWGKYKRETLIGVGYVIYSIIEGVVLERAKTELSVEEKQLVHEGRAWLKLHLSELLRTNARRAYKVKWVVGALGFWWVPKIVYKYQGRMSAG